MKELQFNGFSNHKQAASHSSQARFTAAQVVPELIERNFGEYELQSDSMYQKVWEVDAYDLTAAPHGSGESVEQVPKADICIGEFPASQPINALFWSA